MRVNLGNVMRIKGGEPGMENAERRIIWREITFTHVEKLDEIQQR